MGILAMAALNAQHEAEHQRAGAEGLVDFMLTDLRDRLKAVGRLDLLTTVNKRALSYYAYQDLTRLSADSLECRARIFHAMGEDDESRGNDKLASKEFQEARRTTAQLLAQRPNDPERIFDEAQSEYWIGYIAYEKGNLAAAKESFRTYKTLADRLISIAPDNPRFVREVGYALVNLCAADLVPPKDTKAALVACTAAIKNMERLIRLDGDTGANELEFANRHAWLAEAFGASGDSASSLSEVLSESRILDALIARDPNNAGFKFAWVACQRTLALREGASGQFMRAHARQTSVAQVIDAMIRLDPSNTRWTDQRKRLRDDVSTINKMEEKERAK
jgi:tetratricopeptide (TPR) repeat protein